MTWELIPNDSLYCDYYGIEILTSCFYFAFVNRDFILLEQKTQDFSILLSKFKGAQERHIEARRESVRKKSLKSDPSTNTAEI